MEQEIKIEKGIPIPSPIGQWGKWKDLANKMEVGDSVFIDTKDKKSPGGYRAAVFRSVSKIDQNKKFISRIVENGFRIWRIK